MQKHEPVEKVETSNDESHVHCDPDRDADGNYYTPRTFRGPAYKEFLERLYEVQTRLIRSETSLQEMDTMGINATTLALCVVSDAQAKLGSIIEFIEKMGGEP